jgi:hypothetical protein
MNDAVPDGVSVVIVNFNSGFILADCLRSIIPQADEVVLVDNGSDATADDFIPDLNSYPNLICINLKRNIGFAAACNRGIYACRHPNVLLLNPDCIASSGLVKRLLDVLQSHERAGMAGGLLLNSDGTEQRGGRRLHPSPLRVFAEAFQLPVLTRIFPSYFRGFNLNKDPLPARPTPVEAISGACMMVRRSALESVGLMDEGFFLHWEDLDLCLRLQKQDWLILFDPDATVTHLKGACSRRRPFFVEWHKHKGMVRFYNKHFKNKYILFLYPFIFAAIYLRFIALSFLIILCCRRSSAPPLKGATIPPRHPSERPNAVIPTNNTLPTIGVLGASSLPGRTLLPLLVQRYLRVLAFSRHERESDNPALIWKKIRPSDSRELWPIPVWVSMCPLPVLADLTPFLASRGVERLVAVSSTSLITKVKSVDAHERRLAREWAAAEDHLLKWAGRSGVKIVILRPTLIYDGVEDKNVAVISRFLRRWGWFPVLGPASGMRQPLHVLDLASACLAALSSGVAAGVYELSGGERLSYQRMVARIFAWEGVPSRILRAPRWTIRLLVPLLRVLPGFRDLSISFFERMNEDLVFDHSAAAEALGFNPRKFEAPSIFREGG